LLLLLLLSSAAPLPQLFEAVTKKAMRLKRHKKEKESDADFIARRNKTARDHLQSVLHWLPPTFGLALSPRFLCTSVVTEKCQVMNSKQAPLWLCLQHTETHGPSNSRNLLVIFKVGPSRSRNDDQVAACRISWQPIFVNLTGSELGGCCCNLLRCLPL
jgi:hypothetical protein